MVCRTHLFLKASAWLIWKEKRHLQFLGFCWLCELAMEYFAAVLQKYLAAERAYYLEQYLEKVMNMHKKMLRAYVTSKITE